MTAAGTRPLASLFEPGSVAVVGASNDPRKWGNWLATGALRGEHRRPVYLINRREREVLGRRAYASLEELPEAPELVVITVPAVALATTVEQALAAGTRAIVAITAGAEGEAGGAEEAALAARVREAGAVLLGPNCLGVFDAEAQLELASNAMPGGPIGLISQSGNLALELALFAQEAGTGFSRFVSLGNQADLDAAALLDALTHHAETEVIALYVEDFRDGRAFARSAHAAAQAGKPVVLLAMESGEATSRAVRSHTGALASGGAAIDAACRAAGIHRVRTPRELVDLAQALLRAPRLTGRRVAVLADGGGHGGVAAAAAVQAGLSVPELSPATAGRLREELPATAAVANPIDLAGGAEQDIHTFDRCARVILGSGEIDAVLITGYFCGYSEYTPAAQAEEIATAGELGASARELERPIVVQTMYPATAPADALREAEIPVYRSIEQAVSVLARLAGAPAATGVPGLPEAAERVSDDSYVAARGLLAAAGVPFARQRAVRSREQALSAAQEIGYPVVLKALGLLHKSDAGGVILGLGDAAALGEAYDALVARLAPELVSVEQMVDLGEGVELLIGARWDPRFGPVALAGLGGIYTETLGDVAVALAPLEPAEAERLLRSLRAWPLLSGARGRPPLDVAQAASALVALSRVAAEHPEIAELEVNPLLLTPSEAIALDARLVLA